MDSITRLKMDRFNLKWPAFSDQLSGLFGDLYREGKFTDVTLVCNDHHQIRAHKAVLSACSPVFRSILASHHQIHPVIILRGVHYLEMDLVLQFMYFGQTTVFRERTEELLRVAGDFEMKELSDLCQEIWRESSEEEAINTDYERIKEEDVTTLTESLTDLKETWPGWSVCERCGLKLRASGPGAWLYSCQSCEETFQQVWRLRKHVYHQHHQVKRFCRRDCSPKVQHK